MSIRIVRASFALIAAMLITSGPASAAPPQRTFVSGTGNDANPCSLALPCRTFGAAIAAVASGGEVIALDSAGYGTMTITKSVSVIVPPGIHAAISAAAGQAINVNVPGGNVTLRGLYLSGSGGATGILVNAAFYVRIENCVVNGFTGAGIEVVATPSSVTIVDTISRSNSDGVRVDPPNAGAFVTLDHVRLLDNVGSGLQASAHARVAVRDSTSEGNDNGYFAASDARVSIVGSLASRNTNGFWAYAQATDMIEALMNIDQSSAIGNTNGVLIGSDVNNGPGTIVLTRSSVADNANIGLGTGGSGQSMFVSDSTITRNNLGIQASGGSALVSRSNNTVTHNTTNGSFTGTFLPQ